MSSSTNKLSPELEHMIRHQDLHKMLDELLACYICNTGGSVVRAPIADLLSWAYLVALKPTPPDAHVMRDPARVASDFEAERQIIMLALGELLLERPGWDLPIKEIALRLGSIEELENFMRANADRISPEGRKPLAG